MIQANELRIGNWILWNMPGGSIQPILVASIPLDDDNYSPIPLTTEILEKAGFEKDEDYTTHEGKMYVSFNLPDGTTIDKLGDNDFEYHVWDNYEKHIKYLHQLQNLYFALTGEELEINL